MENELMVVEGGPQLAILRKPDAVLSEAESVARVFQTKANQMALYQPVGDSKHLKVEGWQLLGHMFNCTARYVDDRYIQFGNAQGFEATYEIVHTPSDRVISKGSAMCLNDEERWRDRPKYEWVTGHSGKKEKVQNGFTPVPLQQIRSMAQTRAQSKAFSNAFRFIAKMGGFAGTPAEELDDSMAPEAPKLQSRSGGNHQQRQQPSQDAPTDSISEKQAKRMYAIGMGVFGNSKDDFNAWLKEHGYSRSTEIPSSQYEALIEDLQKQGEQV